MQKFHLIFRLLIQLLKSVMIRDDDDEGKVKSPWKLLPNTSSQREICIFRTTGSVRLFKQYHGKHQLETAACERCNLGLIWGKRGLQPRRTAPEIIWRCRLQEAGGRSESTRDFGEGEYMESSTYLSRRFPASRVKLLLVMRNHRHHEGFQCFSRHEDRRIGFTKSAPENI